MRSASGSDLIWIHYHNKLFILHKGLQTEAQGPFPDLRMIFFGLLKYSLGLL